ncbi:MAG: TM0106 family RecB-like putative nuclease [Elusimicrobia bacterium]|nr:TM0106 family RecB-like putative nuclease [Elusimicrobiota bacterium]
MRHADWAPELEQALDVWGAIRDNILQPEPAKPPNAASAPWRVFANRLVSERKDLILLAGVSREWRQKLRDNGILTTTQAALAGPQKLKELTDESAGADIFGNAAANELNAPVLRGDRPMALPQRARNLYFDFENADAIAPDTKPYVYLIGVWDAETGKYTALLARSQREEEKIFRDFAELVGDPAQALLYHWTEHEAHHIKLAANDYPAISSAMRGLLSACCDLKKAVQKAFYLPAPSFSLKAAAPAFGFDWRQHECGAMDSMAYYWDWISNNNEDAIKKVLVYNEDDCLAMHHIHRSLAQNGHFSIVQALEKINSGRTS